MSNCGGKPPKLRSNQVFTGSRWEPSASGRAARSRKAEDSARVYSYVVTFDKGFSPNPFHGACTLACCKPQIRAGARAGDLIVGLSKRGERLVYAMRVGRVLAFPEYWNDSRFAAKRPRFKASRAVDRRGDNIYEPWGVGEYRQLPSNHSHPDGTENIGSKQTDLGGLHVLVADRFVYYGREGPELPEDLEFLRVGRGHRCRFSDDQRGRVMEWFEALPTGMRGCPSMWPPDDVSWREA